MLFESPMIGQRQLKSNRIIEMSGLFRISPVRQLFCLRGISGAKRASRVHTVMKMRMREPMVQQVARMS